MSEADLTRTIAPKSDQLNADDLIGGPMTIKVSKVSLQAAADQPVAISFEGDNNKPYKPCKSMRRVLVMIWGGDGNAFIGRRMTLFRDDKVQFGGVAVGGIRISHMSDITADVTLALTTTRSTRRPFTVKPLRAEGTKAPAARAVQPQGSIRTIEDALREKAALGTWDLEQARRALQHPDHKSRAAAIAAELDRIAAAADAQDSHPGAEVSTAQVAVATEPVGDDLPF